jgi:nucleoside-diphosphate-sugar epimerase
LVSGGAGFIGSAVRRRAAELGRDAVALVRPSEVHLLGACSQHRVIDWRDASGLEACLRSMAPSAIVHCAGASARGTQSAAAIYDANVSITARLLEVVAGSCSRAHVVLVSSAAVYGPRPPVPTPETASLDPQSHYATSKIMTETLGWTFAWQCGLHVAVARPYNVFGPGEPTGSVVSELATQVLAEPAGAAVRVRLREVVSVRDFVDIDDVADALLVIADKGEAGGIYNVCSGVGTSVARLVEEAGRVWGRTLEIAVADNEAPGTVSIGDGARLRALGWAPRHPLRDSLARMARAASGGSA